MTVEDIQILYASATGTAEDVAYYLAKKLQRLKYFKVKVSSIDDYDYLSQLPEQKNVLFVVSTTGDGDPPSSMRNFWMFLLRRSLLANALSDLKYSIFGLGDSSYAKYNAVARRLNTRLNQLGGTEICFIGLGDDQAKHGYFDALGIWISSVENYYCKSPPKLLSDLSPISLETSQSSVYDIQFFDSIDNSMHDYKSTSANDVHDTIVVENIRMTQSDWSQDVRHIKLKFPAYIQSPIYAAGDIAEVFYCNSEELVNRAIRIAAPQLLPSTWMSISFQGSTDTARKTRISSTNCTLFELFTKVLDVGAIPTRSFFEEMAAFATIGEEKEKLLELSSGEGTDLYWDYCVRERRNYVEVLEDFRSVRPPLAKLLEHIPVVRPRQYSIASSPLEQENCIDLCVAIVKRRTPYRREVLGLCSGYLAGVQSGQSVSIRIRKGILSACKLRENINSPAILVGPGTGVAPMRSFLRQIAASQKAYGDRQQNALNVMLFFGCRKKGADYLYGEEWTAVENSSSTGSNRLVVDCAFSQDQQAKVYVTHRISSRGKEVWDLLQSQNCCVLVSGSAKKMPDDVKQALKDVLKQHGGLDDAVAERRLSDMMRSKHYVVEAWS